MRYQAIHDQHVVGIVGLPDSRDESDEIQTGVLEPQLAFGHLRPVLERARTTSFVQKYPCATSYAARAPPEHLLESRPGLHPRSARTSRFRPKTWLVSVQG